jgi:hypothetical protein
MNFIGMQEGQYADAYGLRNCRPEKFPEGLAVGKPKRVQVIYHGNRMLSVTLLMPKMR